MMAHNSSRLSHLAVLCCCLFVAALAATIPRQHDHSHDGHHEQHQGGQHESHHYREATWEELINLYNMAPLEGEGGTFVQTYVADETIPVSDLPARFSRDPSTRPYSTAIYFLLRGQPYDDKSALHMLAMDEVWHYYLPLRGQLTLVILHPDSGEVEVVKMGHDVLHGEVTQHVVPHGTWLGAFVSRGDYAFIGNTNAPGFVYQDWRLGNKTALLHQFPQAAEWIELLAA